jgi:hypothetical protein
MNATMVVSGTKAVSPVVSSIEDIPPAKIRSHPFALPSFDLEHYPTCRPSVTRRRVCYGRPPVLTGPVDEAGLVDGGEATSERLWRIVD